jgi:protein TonB
MKSAHLKAFLIAGGVHIGLLLFGGLLLFRPAAEHPRVIQDVDLSGPLEDEKADDKKKPAETERQKTDQAMEAQGEQLPDARELVQMDSAANAAPALQALSLADLESALNPNAVGEAILASGVRFTSGGIIGGTGVAGDEAGGMTEMVFSLADLDQQPRAVFQTPPNYPADLRKRKVEGTVYVVFIVDQNGRVVNPRVEKTTHPAFERPALEAIKNWKFEPGVKAGQKVHFKMRVPITFNVS